MPKYESFERRSSDPTPAQIQERAALIRERWSRQTTKKRRVSIPLSWKPPLIVNTQWCSTEVDDFNDAA